MSVNVKRMFGCGSHLDSVYYCLFDVAMPQGESIQQLDKINVGERSSSFIF